MNANIIVLNYNGENLIPQCLPSIVDAKRHSKNAVRITVIDNESTDRSLDVLREYSQEIEIRKCSNRVLCSYNDVVKQQEDEIAILLNNDIRVDKGFIDPLLRVFETEADAFMVAPKCFDFIGNTLEGGSAKGFIRFGWFGATARFPGWEEEKDEFGYTFQSGFGAIRKDRFLDLGGYDDLYLPGRLEDSDICFRAWKKGWKCFYQPESQVYHKGGESFKEKFGIKGMSTIDSRNSFLFFWKNITTLRYWIGHILYLPVRFIWWLSRGEINAIKGFREAVRKIPGVLKKRKAEKKVNMKFSDTEIFHIFR